MEYIKNILQNIGPMYQDSNGLDSSNISYTSSHDSSAPVVPPTSPSHKTLPSLTPMTLSTSSPLVSLPSAPLHIIEPDDIDPFDINTTAEICDGYLVR